MNSAVGRKSGLTEEDLLELSDYRNSERFSAVEKDLLDYVSRMSESPVSIPDSLFESLGNEFTPRQLVELTALAAWENYRARFNRGFDVRAQGFSEGAVCPLPEPPSQGTRPGEA